MKNILIVATCALALSGCLPATKEGRPWYGESFAGTPEHRALEAKYAGQREEARKRDEARLARERYLRQINAEYHACNAANDEAQRKAKVYQQSQYRLRDCSPLRRE